MLNKFKYLFYKNRCYCENEINKEQLEKIVNKGAVLVDVRSLQEYNEGHLENAISLPEYEIKNKAEKVLLDKTQTIIVYCTSGYRSEKAKKKLEKLGYKTIYNLCKGLENYN